MIILDIVFCVIALMIGYKFKDFYSIFNQYDKKVLNQLFAYHLVITITFFYYLSEEGGDALGFWFVNYSKNYTLDYIFEIMSFRQASGFIMLLNYFPAKVLGLSFFTGTLLYAVLGYIGFIYFYLIIKENIPSYLDLRKCKIFAIPIFPILLFLPNLHFWSSGIGKDTILFFCIALFIYSISNIKKRFFGILIALVFSLIIRPHITLFLLVSFGIALTFSSKIKSYQKIILFLIFSIGFISVVGYVLQFLKLESFDADSIQSYSTKKISVLGKARTESSIDVSNYPLPLKVFTFLYRPLFFDAPGILGILSSFENLALLLFSFKVLISKPFAAFRNSRFQLMGLPIFFFIGSLAFSLILGNLGIMLRQKTPFIMAFIIFGYWVILLNEMKKRNVIL